MTRVDFYLLEETGEEDRLRFACRLVEKVRGRQMRVYIHTPSASTSKAMGQMLGESSTTHPVTQGMTTGAARPHNKTGRVSALIGHGAEPDGSHDVLINLCDEVPRFFSRFPRALEILDQREQVQKLGRKRYRYYLKRGYPLRHHVMD